MYIKVDEPIKYSLFRTKIDPSDIDTHALWGDFGYIIHHSYAVSSLEGYAGKVVAAGIEFLVPFHRNDLIAELGRKIVGIAACACVYCNSTIWVLESYDILAENRSAACGKNELVVLVWIVWYNNDLNSVRSALYPVVFTLDKLFAIASTFVCPAFIPEAAVYNALIIGHLPLSIIFLS